MKNNYIPYEELETKVLEDMLANHDCGLSEEDGCDCTIVQEILEKRLINLNK